MGRAYGNIANSYYAVGLYEQAIKYHKQELIISKEVGDRSAGKYLKIFAKFSKSIFQLTPTFRGKHSW